MPQRPAFTRDFYAIGMLHHVFDFLQTVAPVASADLDSTRAALDVRHVLMLCVFASVCEMTSQHACACLHAFLIHTRYCSATSSVSVFSGGSCSSRSLYIGQRRTFGCSVGLLCFCRKFARRHARYVTSPGRPRMQSTEIDIRRLPGHVCLVAALILRTPWRFLSTVTALTARSPDSSSLT